MNIHQFHNIFFLSHINLKTSFALRLTPSRLWLKSQSVFILFYFGLYICREPQLAKYPPPPPSLGICRFRNGSNYFRVWHTAAIFVEIVKRVETGLLLLVCLERVASLKVGVLHDCGPAGLEWEKWGKNKTKNTVLQSSLKIFTLLEPFLVHSHYDLVLKVFYLHFM